MKLKFGESFKCLRKEKNITQERIAEILGVSCQSVSRWELGVCYPDLELLPNIANYFGVTIDQLLCNDELSKESDKELFIKTRESLQYGSLEQIELCQEYYRKYPEDSFYAWQLATAICPFILKNPSEHKKYYSVLENIAEKLVETDFRFLIVEIMVITSDDEHLEKWLDMCPYFQTFNRRGFLISRYSRRNDTDNFYINQGLEALEKLSNQLERRFPDAYGPKRKAEYHRKVLNIIENFGDECEPPDGWKLFYAYKQLVYSACLLGAGEKELGVIEFNAAIDKYKYIFDSKEEYLDLGGELFSNLKVNKDWSLAIDSNGNTYKLFGISYLSYFDAKYLYNFLINPRWAWFDSIRDTNDFKQAIEWAKSKI